MPIKPSSSTAKAKDDDIFNLSDRYSSSESSPPVNQHDVGHMIWSVSRQTAAKPGHVQRLKSQPSTESESSTRTIEDRLKSIKQDNTQQVKLLKKSLSVDESQQLDEECLQRFIKLNVRLMTDDRVSNKTKRTKTNVNNKRIFKSFCPLS